MSDATNLPKPSMPAGNTPLAPQTAPAGAPTPAALTAPVVAPAPLPAASAAPAPAATPQQPVIQSSLLRNLQSVSSVPFQDPRAAQASPIAASTTPSSVPAAAANPPASTNSPSTVTSPSTAPLPPAPLSGDGGTSTITARGAIPQEAPGMSAGGNITPPSGRKPASTGSEAKKPASARLGMFASMGKTVWLAVGGVAVFLIAAGALAWTFILRPGTDFPGTTPPTGTSASRTIELEYWGLWEPVEVMQPIIDAYEKQNPGVNITYTQQNSRQYRQRLQTALDDGSGPDIFRYHNTWLPMMRPQLAVAPTRVFSAQELEQNFYPIMDRELAPNDQVVGVPLMYEGLALLYNKSILESANALPPQDWNELRQLANQLTIRRDNRIERAGVALGTAENVDHFSDILGLMMLQNGANPGNPTTANAQAALEFYTLFSRTDNVWDTTMPNSTVAFANEQVVMIFAPSWRIHEIQELNPNIDIGVARMPQLGGEDITWGTYWVEGVNKQSTHAEESWKFLAYLAQAEQLRAFHSQAASLRGYGELYPRVDMAASLESNEQLSPYLDDALYAYSWYMAGSTFDEGLNDQIIKYYVDAVNMMRTSGQAEDALTAVTPGIQQVMSKFGVSLPTGAAPSTAAPPPSL